MKITRFRRLAGGWLGRAPADVYSALDQGGLVENNSSTSTISKP